jgi:hypothetical protein
MLLHASCRQTAWVTAPGTRLKLLVYARAQTCHQTPAQAPSACSCRHPAALPAPLALGRPERPAARTRLDAAHSPMLCARSSRMQTQSSTASRGPCACTPKRCPLRPAVSRPQTGARGFALWCRPRSRRVPRGAAGAGPAAAACRRAVARCRGCVGGIKQRQQQAAAPAVARSGSTGRRVSCTNGVYPLVQTGLCPVVLVAAALCCRLLGGDEAEVGEEGGWAAAAPVLWGLQITGYNQGPLGRAAVREVACVCVCMCVCASVCAFTQHACACVCVRTRVCVPSHNTRVRVCVNARVCVPSRNTRVCARVCVCVCVCEAWQEKAVRPPTRLRPRHKRHSLPPLPPKHNRQPLCGQGG